MVFNATFNNISVILRSHWRWLKSDKRSCDEYIFVFVFHTEFAFVTFGFGQLFCNQVTQTEHASVVCRLTNQRRSHKNKFVNAILKRNLPLSFNPKCLIERSIVFSFIFHFMLYRCSFMVSGLWFCTVLSN